MNIDQSKSEFEKYKSEFEKYKSENISESDTRSKLLDFMLKNVLGWNEDDIDREKYVKVGYFDYLLRIPNFQMLVEAKKNLNILNFPVTHKTTSLNSIYNANKEVIDQIRSYLIEASLQNGIISNGSQFIIGQFVNIDGNEWLKNTCVIFNGIEDLEERFLDFYNLISREALIYRRSFLNSFEEIFSKNIYSSLNEVNSEIVRNTLSSELTPILDEVFDEIFKYEVLNNKDLITECFVENREILKNRSDIERLFGDRPPQLAEVVKARNTESIFKQIRTELETPSIGINEIAPPKPIIIVGTKGAGKTTFINYLFKSVLDDTFYKNRLPVYLDFRKYTGEDFSTIYQKIYKDLIVQIHQEYEKMELYSTKVLKRIYSREIKENDAGIWNFTKSNNPEMYNEKIAAYFEESMKNHENHFIKLSHYLLRERNIRLILILDNADQFELPIQRDVFLLAQSINKKGKCGVVLSLREGYYYEWRNKPPFDAFINNVYHITAPPYKEILQKRIDYALKSFSLKGVSTGAYGLGNFQITNDSIIHFLKGLKNSLFVDENSKMLQYLEETTYPNLREGLKIFRDFLLSGHTEVAGYIIRHQVDPSTTKSIPFREFLRAIALLNKKYYSHEQSTVSNLFSPASGNNSIYLKFKILKTLFSKIENLGSSERFILAKDLIDEFQLSGYLEKEIYLELSDLLKHRLIETDDQLSDIEFNTDIKSEQNLSISLKGKYYISNLIFDLTYFELCLQDTPIYSKNHFEKIKLSFPLANENGKRSLKGRYDNILDFLDYLSFQDSRENGNQEIINYILSNGLKKEIDKFYIAVERLHYKQGQK